jgi:hypothetical protein
MRSIVAPVLVAIGLVSAGSAGAFQIDQQDPTFQPSIAVTRDGVITFLGAAQTQLAILDGMLASIDAAIKELLNDIARLEEKEKDEQGAVKDASEWQLTIVSSLARQTDAYDALTSLFSGPGCVLCFTTGRSGDSTFDPAAIPSDLSPLNGPLSLAGTLNPMPLQISGVGTFSIDCGTPECSTHVSYRRSALTSVPEPTTFGLFAAALAVGLALRRPRQGCNPSRYTQL